jgi:cobalt-zinc-cadmium efflux system outer membrane protein
MAAAYPQVLIAQRTLFQARTEYVAALVELWQNVAQLRGMLLTGGLGAPMQMSGSSSGRTGSN